MSPMGVIMQSDVVEAVEIELVVAASVWGGEVSMVPQKAAAATAKAAVNRLSLRRETSRRVADMEYPLE